jgi:hypothetical protein
LGFHVSQCGESLHVESRKRAPQAQGMGMKTYEKARYSIFSVYELPGLPKAEACSN